ncbi:hypothetical protein Pelo_6979 [Pelomyxa schiedti]|nr:hypothetical protein Pelo_6979 [Pelomyxa schiedti]
MLERRRGVAAGHSTRRGCLASVACTCTLLLIVVVVVVWLNVVVLVASRGRQPSPPPRHQLALDRAATDQQKPPPISPTAHPRSESQQQRSEDTALASVANHDDKDAGEEAESEAEAAAVADRLSGTQPPTPSYGSTTGGNLGGASTAGGDDAESNYGTVEGAGVTRRVFPEMEPSVCVAALSCRRLHLLEKSLAAIINHMELYEPNLKYEICWVDNHSELDKAYHILESFPIEKNLLLKQNYGLGFAFNTLFFDLCRWSTYVLSIEEDWLWRPQLNFSVIQMGISVLRNDPNVGVIYLKPTSTETQASEWLKTPDGVVYRRHCPKRDSIWGVWANGAVLFNLKQLSSKVGRQTEEFYHDYGAEANYASRAKDSSLCSAELKLFPDCESRQCNYGFTHIGVNDAGKRAPSPCYSDDFLNAPPEEKLACKDTVTEATSAIPFDLCVIPTSIRVNLISGELFNEIRSASSGTILLKAILQYEPSPHPGIATLTASELTPASIVEPLRVDDERPAPAAKANLRRAVDRPEGARFFENDGAVRLALRSHNARRDPLVLISMPPNAPHLRLPSEEPKRAATQRKRDREERRVVTPLPQLVDNKEHEVGGGGGQGGEEGVPEQAREGLAREHRPRRAARPAPAVPRRRDGEEDARSARRGRARHNHVRRIIRVTPSSDLGSNPYHQTKFYDGMEVVVVLLTVVSFVFGQSPNECSTGCPMLFTVDYNCQWACNNEECNWDGGKCSPYCALNCLNSYVGDGGCYPPCYFPSCDYDGGDCDGETFCSDGCASWMIGNGNCDTACQTEACLYDSGDCDSYVGCSALCYENGGEAIGDGLCDPECYCADSDWDGGDCDPLPAWQYRVESSYNDASCNTSLVRRTISSTYQCAELEGCDPDQIYSSSDANQLSNSTLKNDR